MTNSIRKSDAWMKSWRSHIGGGRSAASAGVHEFMTPVELYFSMAEGVDLDPETNPNIMRGIMLEPVALQRLKMLYTDLWFTPHDQEKFIHNPRYPWASDLPDFWVEFEGAMLPGQIKVPTPDNFNKLDERLPDYIRCNCIHSAIMNDAPAAFLACLNPVTMEVWRRVIEPESEEVEALMKAEASFYENHIVPRIPPPPRTSDDVRLLWPEAAIGERIHATPEIYDDMRLLVGAKAREKAAKAEIDDLSLRIKTFMETSDALIGDGDTILATWKSYPYSHFDVARFSAAHPELYAQYTEDRPRRSFLVKSKNLIANHT